jgi:riboflavin transporter FmnP
MPAKTGTGSKTDAKTVAVCGMLCAMAYALTAVSHFLLPPLLSAAPFIKYDPKDVILAIGALLLGPVPALLVTVVSAFLEMLTFSTTGWIGLVMNIVSSAAFILPGALLYRRRRKLSSAVIGLICGVVLMTGMMLLWNAFLTPLYMGMPREAVIGMLVPVFLPVNAIKGALNAAITLLLYKPLTRALRGARLLPAAAPSENGRKLTAVTVVCAAVILAVSLTVLFLLNRGA